MYRAPHLLFRICCLVVVALTADVANAQLRLPFQGRNKATSTSDQGTQQLSERAGPWLVMCDSFAGDDGMYRASQLADELRAEFDLPVYVYRHHFDVEQRLTGQGLGRSVAPQGPGVIDGSLPKKLASAGQFEEFAVLIGDFPSLDDGRAQQTLADVKDFEPSVSVSVESFDAPAEQAESALKNAFMMPNPLLPEAYFSRSVVDDEFVLKMNKRTKYSLLKNPGQYTVRVATFTGDKAVAGSSLSERLKKMNDENKLFKSRKSKASNLETALLKAGILARYLREELGLEAYEFHDRQQSYVCVGSFDWTTRQSVGGTESNPELKKVVDQFTGKLNKVSKNGVELKTLELPKKFLKAHIFCSGSPEVMAVPKPKSASVASRIMGKLR